ncbi:protein kinase domain-containing protein [Nannocystis pusilla]|uniref:protein kinase domain-containing protein n=1 Tax=Nannocystis pusilla TaxID=889268 RepID=UPI003B815F0F
MISGRIVHPHVLRMTDAGTYNGRPYAVSPASRGGHLGAPRRALAKRRAVHAAVPRGMRALHEASAFADPDQRTRVLHRDIKPDNCMVSPEGHVTIIDLGVIKPLDMKLRATTVGALVGSTAYMAPEYLFGFARATERSDVYSLGVSFFEMLTRELPYVGIEPEDFYKELAGRREARSVRELKPEISPPSPPSSRRRWLRCPPTARRRWRPCSTCSRRSWFAPAGGASVSGLGSLSRRRSTRPQQLRCPHKRRRLRCPSSSRHPLRRPSSTPPRPSSTPPPQLRRVTTRRRLCARRRRNPPPRQQLRPSSTPPCPSSTPPP